MGRSQQQVKQSLGLDHVFQSGKYKGFTVGEVVADDPNYIIWLHEKTDADFSHIVIEEAEERASTWTP